MNFNEAMQILGNKLQEKYGHLGFKYKKSDKTLTRHSKNFTYMIAFSSFGGNTKDIRAFLDENDDCIDVVNEMIEDGTLEADGKISEDEFVKALFVNNVTIFVNGSETGFYIDLDAEPDYFMGHLVCIEVDCKYKIEVGGFNG